MAPADTTIIPASNGELTNNVVTLPKHPEPTTPSGKALSFVREHPVLTVAGGIAVGLAISALMPRRVSRKYAKRALGYAEAGAAAALSFSQDALEKAEDGGVIARKKGKLLVRQAEKLGSRAAARAEKFGDIAATRAGKLSEQAVAGAERLGVAALGTAGVWGHAAADRAETLGQAAAVHAESLGGRASDRLSQFGDKALVQSSKLFGRPTVRASFVDRLLDKLHGLRARTRG